MVNALRLSRRSKLTRSVDVVGSITIRSVSVIAGTGSSTTAILPKPTGATTGDVLYAAVTTANGLTRAVTPPTGWTLIATTGPETGTATTDIVQRIYRRWVDGTEGSTFTFSTVAAGGIEARCIAVSGVHTTYPEDIPGAVGLYDGNTSFIQGGLSYIESSASGMVSPPPVYVYTNGSLLIGFSVAVYNGQSWSAPAGMTEQLDTAPQATSPPFLNGSIMTESVNSGFQQKYIPTAATNSQAVSQLLVLRAAGASSLPPYPTPVGNIYSITPPNHYLAIQQSVEQVPAGASSASKNIVRLPSGGAYDQARGIWFANQTNKVLDLNNSTFTATYPLDDSINHSFTLWRCQDFQLTNTPGIKATPSIIGTFNPTQAELDTYLNANAGTRISTPQYRSPAYVGNHPSAPSGNQFQSGVQIYGGDNVTVEFLHIARVFGDGVAVTPYGQITGAKHVGYPTNIYVRDCKVVRTARQGLAPTAVNHCRFERIELIDIWYWGMDAEADEYGDSPAGSAQPVKDLHCLDCSIDGVWFGGLTCPVPFADVDGVYFRNFNQKSNTDIGAYPPIWFNIYDSTRTMLNIEVTGCTLRDQGGGGVKLHDVQNGIVTGNTVTRVAGSSAAILITHSPGVDSSSRTYTTTPNTLIGY